MWATRRRPAGWQTDQRQDAAYSGSHPPPWPLLGSCRSRQPPGRQGRGHCNCAYFFRIRHSRLHQRRAGLQKIEMARTPAAHRSASRRLLGNRMTQQALDVLGSHRSGRGHLRTGHAGRGTLCRGRQQSRAPVRDVHFIKSRCCRTRRVAAPNLRRSRTSILRHRPG